MAFDPECDEHGTNGCWRLDRRIARSLSLLYWMQTEAGWKGLRLRPDIVGTEDGLAKYPYIREPRRIQAEFTALEQHVGTDARMQATGKNKDELTAQPFTDGANQKPPFRFSNSISQSNQRLREVKPKPPFRLDFKRKAWKSSGPN
jgi:FAD dependent oxidoreductase